MTETSTPEQFLAAASIDPSVFALQPDYRALLLTVDGLVPGSGEAASEQLVAAAEAQARSLLETQAVTDLPHVSAWREAYRAFGAKPQRTRNSLESLLRRAEGGLPRVNALTDTYNAISILHQVPVGGEDRARYRGPARLVRAVGDEDFDTTAQGETVIEHPDSGEVIWRDDLGVTCRRWNWRQGQRTGLHDSTRSALFIFDALGAIGDDELHAAATDLATALKELNPGATVSQRLIAAP